MNSEIASFDKFIDDANKQFISFLRNPWKEFDSKKPVEKRVKPEPVKPVVYDEKKDPDTTPVELTIEEILGQSTKESKQRPQGRVIDGGEKVTFDKPHKKVDNTNKRRQPVDTESEKPQPVVKPETPAPVPAPVPTSQPAAPATKPSCPNAKPTCPNAKPAAPATKPTCPNAKPTCPNAKPACPNAKPACPNAKPTCPNAKPACPNAKPAAPATKPTCPSAKPTCPNAKPTCPNAKPTCPNAQPTAPATKPVVVPVTPPAVKPSAPTGELFTASSDKQMVNFCGQKVYVDKSLKGVCSIGNMRENAIADAYEAMCKADYKALVDDCRKVKKELNLNDWGIFLFVREASKTLCTDENAAVVMQQFLLNELGYKSKMARRADRNQMLLFVAADCQVYGHPYFTKDGLNYYNLTSNESCQFYMCQEDSPKAKSKLNMQVNHAPALNAGMVNSVHKNRSGSVAVSVDVPKSLMEFYGSMPQCDYSVYVNAEVNPSVASKVLSTLAPLVNGKGEAEAANLLINFVQTGFQYATDQEQFGYEKPFFVEELFYYPYCDCEDRSVLYSYLVRNLLKLDVVLLDYPNHIATAVCFNENVSGDFVTVGGKKYVVCDPTYIGASIGKAMPQFKNVAAKVLKY
ncbi:hypothetical protein [Leyella stercorea]|uniref:hypothetical protein n=1 Tax=Leyella stercorea TaxID=363265 RepID=UPI001A42E053|nr:hypothetical protein [Leyella stercorea]MBL6516562.1 hypothetical protein [Leyella stercorea]